VTRWTKKKRGLFAYPDFIIVCGEPIYHDEQRDVLINPKLIVEVLSPSTEAYDRDEKFRRYQELESFTDYLLISQERPRVEHFAKQPDGQWVYHIETDPTGSLFILSVNCRIPLSEVYEWVSFPNPFGD